MIPNLIYKVDIEIECVDPNGASDSIKVLVFNKDSSYPMITANF
jgi:hypothetical protein